MNIFEQYEVWFVIGSQHLYGAETLRQVNQHAEQVVNALNKEARLPCKLVLKPLGTTPDEITAICRDASYSDKCAGNGGVAAHLLAGKNVDQRPEHPDQAAVAIPYAVQCANPMGQH